MELFSLESLIVREELQQDKRVALLAVAKMFAELNVPYVVTGGIALQLYSDPIRHTVDVDVVSLRQPFEKLKAVEPWSRYGFELVFDRRRFIKLRHLESNVEVDINVDTRFARVLDQPTVELVEGQRIAFCSPGKLALTKLRTQRTDWPRDPAKRLQDRADLMRIIRGRPAIGDELRDDPQTNDEMRQILDEILRELARPATDDLPPEDE